MVTKGIITSIDFNGNTCKVRIPLFETTGNDPITGTAIVSNTPGSYNGYKVGDVVLVAFEDGKMQNPVIIGKLYLGAAKEKQDPRGTINVETTTASKSASLPADAVLTAKIDSNVPNTNVPFGSLVSIANNLNSLNTDVNQLDRFTRNQFNSVITDVNDQGEQLRSEIKQTADSIEANVVHKHQDGSQDALGWDLTTDSWQINAQDTVNDELKDINIVTIDRNGMSIAGDLKLSGYPRNITVLYAKNNSDKDYPKPLYNFTAVSFPSAQIDKTWYYGKYIKIEENYVLIFKENFEQYSITVGTTEAYNREVNSKVWSTETPKRDDGYYIWQWTHTEIYSFDGGKWTEQDDDKIVCITGAKGEPGEKGDTGIAINNTKQWYILWPTNKSDDPGQIENNTEPAEPTGPTATSTPEVWMSTPPEAVNGYNVWTCYGSIFSDDNPSGTRHITYSTPVKDNAYALAQGKTTNYYSPTEPINNIKKGDCWFDTGYVNVGTFSTKAEYLGKFVSCQPSVTGSVRVEASGVNRYIPSENGSTYLVKITPENINNGLFTVKTSTNNGTDAYETGNLKQWDGYRWTDIAGELVTNKLTANYINAMDITAKKITVLDGANPVFIANTVDPTSGSYDVNIGGFSVDSSTLLNGTFGDDKSVLVSTGYKNASSIGGSPDGEEKEWAFVAGKYFGVTTTGELFASNITISGYATKDDLTKATNDAKSHAESVASTAESNAISEIKKEGYQTAPQVTTITESTIKTTDVIAENLQVKKLLVKDSNENVLLDAGAGNQHVVQIGGFTVSSTGISSTTEQNKYNTSFGNKAIGESGVYLGIDGIRLGDKFSVDNNGNIVANSADISGTITATEGEVGCFGIYENGLYSDFVELSNNSLALTGGKFTLSNRNTGENISLDTSRSNPAIIFSGNGSIIDETGSVGLTFKAGGSGNRIEYKAFLYADGTGGFGGTNSITITIKSKDSSGVWNTCALKKDRPFTIYHKGFDGGVRTRQLTITLKAGESAKTVKFGGYWEFYGASWTSDGTFYKNTEVDGPKFKQTEIVPASLYALSSILPQYSGTIKVYYSASSGSPSNDYKYGGTKEISGITYYKWSNNSVAPGHPTDYYTKETPDEINNKSGSELQSTILYYYNSNGVFSNDTARYIDSANIPEGCSLGSRSEKWAEVYASKLNGEVLNGKVVNTTSDLRLKQNINYDISKYDNLFDSLKPASYQFKSDLNPKTHLGFIAQEVEQSLFDNNLTRKDFAGVNIRGEGFDEKTDTILNLDKTTYALGYNELHALEVRQIQLLKARVQELEAKIEQLIKNKE